MATPHALPSSVHAGAVLWLEPTTGGVAWCVHMPPPPAHLAPPPYLGLEARGQAARDDDAVVLSDVTVYPGAATTGPSMDDLVAAYGEEFYAAIAAALGIAPP